MPVFKVLLLFTLILAGTAQAQGITYNLGRAASAEEIRAWDIAINPEGQELPEGSGNAVTGAPVYLMKCMACHGPDGSGGLAPKLVGRNTVVSNYPFATSLWDYINRAMPLNQEGSLSFDEVYALTAFLLNKGSVIDADIVLSRDNLPEVKMPNRDGYVPPPIDFWEPGMPRIFRIIDP
jgi:S-disulfanyl-L-cysteine oxidoreductase SoxD